MVILLKCFQGQRAKHLHIPKIYFISLSYMDGAIQKGRKLTMKKRLAVLLTGAMVMATLAGCGRCGWDCSTCTCNRGRGTCGAWSSTWSWGRARSSTWGRSRGARRRRRPDQGWYHQQWSQWVRLSYSKRCRSEGGFYWGEWLFRTVCIRQPCCR